METLLERYSISSNQLKCPRNSSNRPRVNNLRSFSSLQNQNRKTLAPSHNRRNSQRPSKLRSKGSRVALSKAKVASRRTPLLQKVSVKEIKV